jgi:hypothetical protein
MVAIFGHPIFQFGQGSIFYFDGEYLIHSTLNFGLSIGPLATICNFNFQQPQILYSCKLGLSK